MEWPDGFINKIICGDCLEVMKTMPDNSIDTIITDPPYGLKFMGKKWDYDVPSIEIWQECLKVLKPGGTALIFAGSRTQHRMAVNIEDAGFILKDCIMWIYGMGFPKATDISKQIDKIAGKEREVIGKSDRHNSIAKSNIINPQGNGGIPNITIPATPEATLWDGWKSHGLKPAYEPIIIAMKPNEGSYANNALKWEVAGLNVDGGRIETDIKNDPNYRKNPTKSNRLNSCFNLGNVTYGRGCKSKGRYPANVILDEESAMMLDEQSGERKSAGNYKNVEMAKRGGGIFGGGEVQNNYANDKGGASRFFYCAKVEKGERNKGRYPANVILDEEAGRLLDEQSGDCKTGGKVCNTDCGNSIFGKRIVNTLMNTDNGKGASRFFYCPKASKAERNRGCEGLEEKIMEQNFTGEKCIDNREGRIEHKRPNVKLKNTHPTVKPLSLMKYLCTLTKTPTGGIVLDPFCGSGTTLMACKESKRDYIGIDNNPEYCEIAKKRINAIPETLF